MDLNIVSQINVYFHCRVRKNKFCQALNFPTLSANFIAVCIRISFVCLYLLFLPSLASEIILETEFLNIEKSSKNGLSVVCSVFLWQCCVKSHTYCTSNAQFHVTCSLLKVCRSAGWFFFFLPVILFILLDHVVKSESSFFVVCPVCPLPQIIKVVSHIDHYF